MWVNSSEMYTIFTLRLKYNLFSTVFFFYLPATLAAFSLYMIKNLL